MAEEKIEKPQENVPSQVAVKMIDEIRSPAKNLKLKDKNWSWPAFITTMLYLVVIAILLTQAINSAVPDQGRRLGIMFGSFLCGALGGVLIYNLGHHLFALSSGYHLYSLCLSGLIYRRNAKKKWHWDLSQAIELHSAYAPKNDNIDANPLMMSIGGFILWGIVFVALIVVFTVTGLISDVVLKWALVYGVAFSGIYPIYQLFPFREDYPSDMFTAVTAAKGENRKAFNLYAINQANDFSDKDAIVPDFASYDTYWKARTLIYVLRNQIDQAKIEDAIKTFSVIHAVSNYLSDTEKAWVAQERIFILLLMNDRTGADTLYFGLKKDVRSEVTKCRSLASFRSALMVSGILMNNLDNAKDNVKAFNAFVPETKNSFRLQQEAKYYALAYDRVKAQNPTLVLPPLTK